MFSDPIFIVALVSVALSIAFWIYKVLSGTLTDQMQQVIYTLGFLSALLGIYRIFVNAGDLGVVLFLGSIMCLAILVVGILKKNDLLKTTGKGWFLPVFFIFVLRTFIYEPYQIPSGSMIPGLQVGDFILVNKHSYGLKINRIGKPFAMASDPEYGDVVVFIPPHVNVPYIKRLIGKPGDTIRYINKKLYINGDSIEQELISHDGIETYLQETYLKSTRVIRVQGGSASYPEEFSVPADHYFVMGDNRDNSSDSRYWGFVPREHFMGTGEMIWMTWECWTCLPSFSRAGWIN
ncbi:signal peptidase I [Gammaproteobacteria bacterium]|nr:signal peptidase I [Gammaproteobacteria bacterium]MDA9258872.1 signal peptidase I [Gammaproteobacteria bacterium]MDA9259523.1 signal peptidase I [Gammaproteobacteria bacterium]MDA9269094.1 signal peptidase I [Gammaproteobacteria bacterium]MDA9292315.1 signal peptidase I [Gammaproteobacteria bacterium]